MFVKVECGAFGFSPVMEGPPPPPLMPEIFQERCEPILDALRGSRAVKLGMLPSCAMIGGFVRGANTNLEKNGRVHLQAAMFGRLSLLEMELMESAASLHARIYQEKQQGHLPILTQYENGRARLEKHWRSRIVGLIASAGVSEMLLVTGRWCSGSVARCTNELALPWQRMLGQRVRVGVYYNSARAMGGLTLAQVMRRGIGALPEYCRTQGPMVFSRPKYRDMQGQMAGAA